MATSALKRFPLGDSIERHEITPSRNPDGTYIYYVGVPAKYMLGPWEDIKTVAPKTHRAQPVLRWGNRFKRPMVAANTIVPLLLMRNPFEMISTERAVEWGTQSRYHLASPYHVIGLLRYLTTVHPSLWPKEQGGVALVATEMAELSGYSCERSGIAIWCPLNPQEYRAKAINVASSWGTKTLYVFCGERWDSEPPA